MQARAGTFVKFMAVGLPAFLVAIPLNYALVVYAGLPKPLAYAIVILAQVTLNFALVRRFVFSREGNARVQFVQFVSAISAVRVLDWITYTVLVTYAHVSFVLAQVLCVGVFAALKFLLSERIFKRRRVDASVAGDADR